MTEGRPTMNDVARHAGVSLKTVSRVVNGETTVDPELVARVRAAVATLHYRPHLGASLLRRNDRRTGTIGLLLQDVGDPFSAVLHRAVEDAARSRGLLLLTGSLDEDADREREQARAFARRHTDGLILAPVGPDQGYLALDLPPDIPVVFVDRPARGFAGDTVLAGDEAGAGEAVRHLLRHGHRRIAYLGGDRRSATGRDRQRGFLRALADRPGPVVHDLPDPPAAERAAILLLHGPDPPTAIVTGRRPITVGVIRALRGLGRHRSVALVGLDDLPLADLLDPAVTAVAQDPARIGRTAADALFERIDGRDDPPREIRIPTALIPRGSGEISGGPTGSS
ncbi:LacI family DNA-binding transcriptional regulator [Actinoplanes sp. NPDC049599]|uniref:LacI family DNA-binding transcriptional regulator n=1 Tax=Actinoplanes sp. NPDC049599 TaxID=3363903 RepID=UPI0037967826